MSKTQQNINILMMLLFSAYAIYSVVYQHSSIFFIIYLFWFDELIRNVSALIQVKMHLEDPATKTETSKSRALSAIKSRFFLLFVYAIFIVLVFGIFFNLSKEKTADLVTNIKIIMFRDLGFNLCIMIALVRETLQIKIAHKNRNAPIAGYGVMGANLLTLHLSIVLGGLLWASINGQFSGFKLNLGTFNQYAIILPFFIVKLLVDFYQIRNSTNQGAVLLRSLHE